MHSLKIKNNNRLSKSTHQLKTCVHRKLEYYAEHFSENTAICFKEEKLNFKELNSASNALAHLLVAKGLKVEDYSIVFLERSLELIISIFGVLKAGGVYVPISSNIPTQRIESIIEDTEPKFILTERSKSRKLPRTNAEIIYLEDFIINYSSLDQSNPKVNVKPNNLAYAIFTSGTTGKPKGVLIEHQSVINRIEWMQKVYPIAFSDIILHKTPITFDVSIWEIFWWSFTGSQLFLLPPEEEKEPQKIASTIEKENISVIHFVPSMFNAFLNYINNKQTHNYLASLKWVFCSGEELLTSHVNDFYNYCSNWKNKAVLVNLYGPTEATVDVTYFTCPRRIEGTVPIGKPIDHTDIYIVDRQNKILPPKTEGELIICGINLARGYLKREKLTNEKFITLDIDGNLVKGYKTGDIAYFNEQGNLIYKGRMDNQVKLRGFRIELSEIENTVKSVDGIKNSAAIIKDETYENAHLVCFYICENGMDIEASILKQSLREKLPDYMVPAIYCKVTDFPLTPSGKLDRKKLFETIEDCMKEQPKKSLSEYEKILQNIWSKLFRRKNISPTINFFDLGGNSLMIVQLSLLIKQSINREIDSITLMQYPTIQSLANFLNESKD